MSRHSHWAGIKHKKGAADEKRGRIFSKLLNSVTVAARGEPNPDFNPRLRTAVQKARAENVPTENIARAIRRATETVRALNEVLMEAYGPGGAALLIEGVTDNTNRTVAEVKKILSDHEGKWAEPGSVRWAFEQAAYNRGADSSPLPETNADLREGGSGQEGGGWQAKFPQELGLEDKDKLQKLTAALEEHEDVLRVYTNTAENQ